MGAFGNPIYQNLITLNPSPALLDELIAPAAGAFGLQNFTGSAYNPAKIYAVIDARTQNTAYQAIQGVDVSAQYRIEFRSGSHVIVNGSASYLDSKRRLLAGQPTVPSSGVIFTPPRWRARGGLTWDSGQMSLASFVNYVDGEDDNRQQPTVHVPSFTSLNLVGHVTPASSITLLQNIQVTLGIMNLLNRKPDIIRHAALLEPTYDSTNYSALGRTINLTVAKRW